MLRTVNRAAHAVGVDSAGGLPWASRRARGKSDRLLGRSGLLRALSPFLSMPASVAPSIPDRELSALDVLEVPLSTRLRVALSGDDGLDLLAAVLPHPPRRCRSAPHHVDEDHDALRDRGDRGLNEALLAKAAAAKVLKTNRVRADTTVVEANVAYPTDSGPARQGRDQDGEGHRAHQGGRSRPSHDDARPQPSGPQEGAIDRRQSPPPQWRGEGGGRRDQRRSHEGRDGRRARGAKSCTQRPPRAARHHGGPRQDPADHLGPRDDRCSGGGHRRPSPVNDSLVSRRTGRRGSSHCTIGTLGRFARDASANRSSSATKPSRRQMRTESSSITTSRSATHRTRPSSFPQSVASPLVPVFPAPSPRIADMASTPSPLRSRASACAWSALPTKGRPNTQRRAVERRRSFRKLVKWRTGSEGRISCLKRDFGWNRTRIDGIEGARTWCGHGIFNHNLVKIAGLMANA